MPPKLKTKLSKQAILVKEETLDDEEFNATLVEVPDIKPKVEEEDDSSPEDLPRSGCSGPLVDTPSSRLGKLCRRLASQVTGVQYVGIYEDSEAGQSRISADLMLHDLQASLVLDSSADSSTKIINYFFKNGDEIREVRSDLAELHREGLHQSFLSGIVSYRELYNGRQSALDILRERYSPLFKADINEAGYCEIHVLDNGVVYLDATWKIVYKREIDSFDNFFEFFLDTKEPSNNIYEEAPRA